MNIEFAPKKVFRILLGIILALLALNIASLALKLKLGLTAKDRVTQYFDFSSEQNIPTLFSTLALLACAALLYIIGSAYRKSNQSYLPWFGLALIFIFLGLDETMSLHEQLSIFLQARLNTEGWLRYPWILPYGIAGLLLLALYIRFMIGLPRRTLIQFALAAALFIGGAIGIEVISAFMHESLLESRVISAITYTCEELLEMLGVAVFIYSLLAFIESRFGRLQISLGEKNS